MKIAAMTAALKADDMLTLTMITFIVYQHNASI